MWSVFFHKISLVSVLVLFSSTCCWNIDSQNGIEERISQKKCREYKQLVNSSCLGSETRFQLQENVAAQKEFPHMALLGYKRQNEIKWLSAGALISEQYVICIPYDESRFRTHGFLKYVRLGAVKTDSEESSSVVLNIAEIIKHPDYSASRNYNDITLLKLERAVRFTEYIRPACLPLQFDVRTDNVVVTGWNWWGTRRLLQKHKFRILDNQECNQIYMKKNGKPLPSDFNNEVNFCANYTEERQDDDITQFMMGSIIQTTDESSTCTYNLHGISSSTKVNDLAPYFFTRIYPFSDWIESAVWPGQ